MIFNPCHAGLLKKLVSLLDDQTLDHNEVAHGQGKKTTTPNKKHGLTKEDKFHKTSHAKPNTGVLKQSGKRAKKHFKCRKRFRWSFCKNGTWSAKNICRSLIVNKTSNSHAWHYMLVALNLSVLGHLQALVWPSSGPVYERGFFHHDDVIEWSHFPRYSPLWGNPLVTDGFPSQRPLSQSFRIFFDLRLNKQLSKQSRRRWFETPSRSLWRHCSV